MRHVREMTTDTLKKILKPEKFYPMMLPDGRFGKGSNDGWCAWNGLCPFHDDRNPGSLYINKNTGAFKCHSCGIGGGDIIDFHMEKECLIFKDSFKRLKEIARCTK